MTHHQIAIEKYGAASTLHVSDLAPRPPGDDEVAIDVAYSGVNFADVQMRLGFYPDAPKRPFVPGYEVSGKVSAVGKNVHALGQVLGENGRVKDGVFLAGEGVVIGADAVEVHVDLKGAAARGPLEDHVLEEM